MTHWSYTVHSMYRSHFSANKSQKTSHSSTGRTMYGVSFFLVQILSNILPLPFFVLHGISHKFPLWYIVHIIYVCMYLCLYLCLIYFITRLVTPSILLWAAFSLNKRVVYESSFTSLSCEVNIMSLTSGFDSCYLEENMLIQLSNLTSDSSKQYIIQ